MKRIIALSLCILTLFPCACQPTPDEEYVVNKGDDALEGKIHATQSPAGTSEPGGTAEGSPAPDETEAFSAVQTFPETWDERIELAEDFYLVANAEVITKADGRYPVFRTRIEPFDMDQISELLDKLIGRPVSSQEKVMTKDDWKDALQAYLAEVEEHRRWIAEGRPEWGHFEDNAPTDEEVAAQSKWFMDQILAAPDAAEQQEASGYGDLVFGKPNIYELASGGTAYVYASGSWLKVVKSCANDPYVFTEHDYKEALLDEEPEAKQWHDVSLPFEDAQAALLAELARLGLEDFAVTRSVKADLMDHPQNGKNKFITGGWLFTLHRNYADYPEPAEIYEPSQLLDYGSDESFIANPPIQSEYIDILIDGEGLQYFGYFGKKSVIGIENPNVELLSFDEIKDRAAKSFRMCFPITKYKLYDEGDTAEIYLYKMYLTTCTVFVKNGQGYYEMPCWVLFFANNGYHSDYEREMAVLSREPDLTRECLFINAIDGSVIHTDFGY